MVSLGLLVLRLTVGSLLAGHGAQKLFGSFGGGGLEGTGGMLHPMGFRPAKQWAAAARARREFGGGLCTALGLMSPLGQIWCDVVDARGGLQGAPRQASLGNRRRRRAAVDQPPPPRRDNSRRTRLAVPGSAVRHPRSHAGSACWLSPGMASFTWLSIQRSDRILQEEQATQPSPKVALEPVDERISEPVLSRRLGSDGRLRDRRVGEKKRGPPCGGPLIRQPWR